MLSKIENKSRHETPLRTLPVFQRHAVTAVLVQRTNTPCSTKVQHTAVHKQTNPSGRPLLCNQPCSKTYLMSGMLAPRDTI